jgi:hypothetical protein
MKRPGVQLVATWLVLAVFLHLLEIALSNQAPPTGRPDGPECLTRALLLGSCCGRTRGMT